MTSTALFGAFSVLTRDGYILFLTRFMRLRLGEKELADKYANLARQMPPPTRKGFESPPPQ